MEWVYNNGGRHSVRGWGQGPYHFARVVAAAITCRHGAPYKRVPRKNGKIPPNRAPSGALSTPVEGLVQAVFQGLH
jgi:hypothetical protein